MHPQDSPHRAGYSKSWDISALILFTLFAILCLFTLQDYGMSWDEWFRWRGGQEKLLYYKNLFQGTIIPATPSGTPDHYPGLFDLSVALINELTGISLFQAGHSLSLGFGFLTILATWLIARTLGGSRAGFLALLLLIATPRFYGHQFFNPKDIPFAATYAWTLLALILFLKNGPRPSWKIVAFLGIAIGLNLSVRVGALIQFGYLGLVCAWMILRETSTFPSGTRRIGSFDSLIGLLARSSVVALIAFSVLTVWWPYSHSNPVSRALETLLTVSEYPWNGPVLFFGEYINASDLPTSYLLVWLGITLPPVVIISLLVGLVLVGANLRKIRMHWRNREFAAYGLLTFAIIFPVVYVMIRNSTIYDGMRHFLFILPPIAVISALALNHFCETARRKRSQFAIWSVILISTLFSLLPMIRLHPYQYVYFNPLIGGLSGADGLFETEYWGTAKREAVEELMAYIDNEYPDDYNPRIASSMPILLSRYFFPENWIPEADPKKADFYVSITRSNLDKAVDGETVVRVERDGVVFALTKSVSPPEDGNLE